jgi:hypothetical protein
MKNLLLFLSILFLGSCGNSDIDKESGLGASKNQFEISSIVIIDSNQSTSLQLNLSKTLTQVTHDELTFSGTFILDGYKKCSFTATKEALKTERILKSLDFVVSSRSCSNFTKGLLFNIPAGSITLMVNGKSMKNSEFQSDL